MKKKSFKLLSMTFSILVSLTNTICIIIIIIIINTICIIIIIIRRIEEENLINDGNF